MKIAFTADAHLLDDGSHPERTNALESIACSMEDEGISTLVIAGDLFDRDCSSYTRFEELCRRHGGVAFHVVPGNHDPDISGRIIIGENVHVHSQPEAMEADGAFLLFLPYSDSTGMGRELEEIRQSGRWILVGHGDYMGGSRQRNPYEKGIYMPLYRRDIQRFQPWRVFLGHLHKPMDQGVVHYPGSPCGLDINETGRRRFLVLDTTSGRVTPRRVDTDVIFFQEKFLVIPDENELERLRSNALARIASWGLESSEKNRVRVRVRAVGFTADREAVLECIQELFGDYPFHNGEGPDISELRVARDTRRSAIARRSVELIEELDWDFGGDQPEKDQVIERALRLIYGRRGAK